MKRLRQILFAVAAMAPFAAVPAGAAEYPSRPITMIVPWGPGGGTGINARALAPYLGKELGQSVLVDFREGAGGITGHTIGAFAKPDGYTLTLVTPGIIAAPLIVPNVKFTPNDYEYIGQVSLVPNMLVVSSDSKYKTLKDLVDAMKAHPKELSTGFMTGWPSSMLAQAAFFARAGVEARVVPGFKGGADMIAQVVGHHIDFGFVNVNEAQPLYEGGKLRVLAVSSPNRAPGFDVPTFRELGYDVAIAVWRTLAAPKGTPKPIIDTLSKALQAALKNPDLAKDFKKLDLSIDYLDPEATRKVIMADDEATTKLLNDIGVSLKGRKASAKP